MAAGGVPVLTMILALGAALPLAADVEDELRARLRGRWAVLRSAVSSECTDHYSDNTVSGRFASGPGPVTLPAGELVTIDNVHVGWTRFDVNLGLAVPTRMTLVDGPFTLHELRGCRVQLGFDVPRRVKRDRARAEAVIREILEVHDSEESARASEAWNGREPEPLPEDAERVWAEYRVWKAETINAAIRERLDDVLEEAHRILRSMDEDADYLESFALGVQSKRYQSFGSCDSALSAGFYRSGSGGRSSRGWADGQRLGWTIALARALQDCWVDAPPLR